MLSECITGYRKPLNLIKKRFFKYKTLNYLERQSVSILQVMRRESVWNVQRCCGLSERSIRRAICQVHGSKKSRNPHIKSSRDLIENSSRDSHKFSENLVETYHHIIKSSRDSHHHSSSLYHNQKTESSRDTRIIISSSRDVCIYSYS